MKEVLYTQDDADALTRSEQTESWRKDTDQKKAELILQYAENAESLLDIGCAWGQILCQLVGKIDNLAGVDESEDRIKELRNKSGIKTYVCSASDLSSIEEEYDIVLTSHIMHEVKLFGEKNDMQKSLAEIKKILSPEGRYFMIDHLDPGEGEVCVAFNDEKLALFKDFAQKFQYRKVNYQQEDNQITLSKRDCHDFVTKIWAMGSGAEDLEMKETHTIMKKNELYQDLETADMHVQEWAPFNSIEIMFDHYGIELVSGEPWERQFMLIAQRVNNG